MDYPTPHNKCWASCHGGGGVLLLLFTGKRKTLTKARSQSSLFYYGDDSDFPARQLVLVKGSSNTSLVHEALVTRRMCWMSVSEHKQMKINVRKDDQQSTCLCKTGYWASQLSLYKPNHCVNRTVTTPAPKVFNQKSDQRFISKSRACDFN